MLATDPIPMLRSVVVKRDWRGNDTTSIHPPEQPLRDLLEDPSLAGEFDPDQVAFVKQVELEAFAREAAALEGCIQHQYSDEDTRAIVHRALVGPFKAAIKQLASTRESTRKNWDSLRLLAGEMREAHAKIKEQDPEYHVPETQIIGGLLG